ncbi:MAG: ribonuclease M5, partial [Clostridia bacterium]|nr:ribonuclease M5 [Clostridia bacterium]
MQKPKINEIVIVEGRDDTRAVLEAVDCRTIETHGFGISIDTWNLIEKAYQEKGIIVFTDPDFTGNEIRKRILSKFPDAKEAFLSRSDATKADDIGIENGKPEEIRKALSKAKATERSEEERQMQILRKQKQRIAEQQRLDEERAEMERLEQEK